MSKTEKIKELKKLLDDGAIDETEYEALKSEITNFADEDPSTANDYTNEISESETVKIGNQVWMKHNLNVDKFRNGDPTPYVKSRKSWKQAGREDKPAWCYYDNDPEN